MRVGPRRRVWAIGLILVAGLACFPCCGRGDDSIGSGKSSAAPPAKGGAKESPSEQIQRVAKRMFAITDAVLDHHIEPATRQEMILAGLRAAFASKKVPAPDLGRRVSDVRTLDELTSLLRELWPKLTHQGEASNDQLEAALFEGLLRPVPGAPSILPAKEARVRAQIQANRYIGIGIALTLDDKSRLPQIKHAMPGGPAALGGVKDGDFIEQINKHRIEPGAKLTDVVDELRGPEGTELTIRVRQPKAKESRTLTLVRLPVMFKSVKNSQNGDGDDRVILVNQKPAIAYLKIDSIMASTPRELAAWEPRLREAKVDGLILDLRGTGAHNSSDNAHAGLLLADSLVDGKSLGTLRTRQNVRDLPADRDCLFRDLPLAVLIDNYTNGPASWVAAILQDCDPPAQKRRRAVVVGLFGGGDNFIRSGFPLPGGDELILPSSVWQRPGAANASKRKVRLYSPVNRMDHTSGSWTAEDETATAHREGLLPDAYVAYYAEGEDGVQNLEFNPGVDMRVQSPSPGGEYLTSKQTKAQTKDPSARKQSKDFDPIQDVAIIELHQQLELAAKKH